MGLQGYIKDTLKNSVDILFNLLDFIRLNYAVDELWDEKDELKFRRGGKTLFTLYIKDGYFTVLIIFGKAEREKFELIKSDYSDFICNYYDNSKTYHDGKWMFIDIKNDTYIEEIKKMIMIKRKPNRKPENLKNAVLGKCCNRCDICPRYIVNHEKGSRFGNGAYKVYEDDSDYSNEQSCMGCPAKTREDCVMIACVENKNIDDCSFCEDFPCEKVRGHSTIAGHCTIGLTNAEIEEYILPYCCVERGEYMKETRKQMQGK